MFEYQMLFYLGGRQNPLSFGDPDERPLLQRDMCDHRVMQCTIYQVRQWSVPECTANWVRLNTAPHVSSLPFRLHPSTSFLPPCHPPSLPPSIPLPPFHPPTHPPHPPTHPPSLPPSLPPFLPYLKTLSFGDPASTPSPSEKFLVRGGTDGGCVRGSGGVVLKMLLGTAYPFIPL